MRYEQKRINVPSRGDSVQNRKQPSDFFTLKRIFQNILNHQVCLTSAKKNPVIVKQTLKRKRFDF